MREIGELQHGVFSRRQAREAGVSRDSERRRVAAGIWERVTARVLRIAGTPETAEQRCMVAVLDAGDGAVVSHETAAALWRLPGFATGQPTVSRPRGGTKRASAVATVHQAVLPAHHVTQRHGIPVTTVARTLFDLAGAVHPKRAERALDHALARRLTAVSAVRAVTDELAERGRAGSGVMGALVAAREDGYVPVESGLEARFLDLVRRAGIPEPQRQRNLGGRDWVGRVDFLFADRRLIVEIDGSVHHSAALDRAADARRDRELRAAGFDVRRLPEEVVWHRPEEVIAALRRLAA